MIRFKNTKKIINPKFLYTLPVACIGVLCTQQTTNAMFRNPKLGMPLMETPGRVVTFERPFDPSILTPKKISSTIPTDTPISITTTASSTSTSLTSSLSSAPITNSKVTKTNTGNLGNTLRGFGDNITSTTTSANGANLGNSLRNFGDRFNQ